MSLRIRDLTRGTSLSSCCLSFGPATHEPMSHILCMDFLLLCQLLEDLSPAVVLFFCH